MRAYFFLWSPGEVFSPVLWPNFYVYAPIFKIRSSRIVSETDQDIKKCSRVYILAVIGNRISHMGQFELKSFFAGGGGGIFSRK